MSEKYFYDFIEIGTYDFDTLIRISIEPVKMYLDNLSNKNNIKKLIVL